jgi:transcription elongation factor S-II
MCRIGLQFTGAGQRLSCVCSPVLLSHDTYILLVAADLIQKRAEAIERAVYDEHGGTNVQYKNKIRMLFVNLQDKNNPGLRESVVSGDLSVDRFTKMTSAVSIEVYVFCL